MKNMELTGIVLLEKISHLSVVMKPKITFSSMKVNSLSFCIKSVDFFYFTYFNKSKYFQTIFKNILTKSILQRVKVEAHL
jgi:hypothetical protein